MSVLVDVILPVFVLIFFGWLASFRRWITDADIDGIMRFAQGFAAPLLLYKNIATIDLGTAFDPGLLLSFYIGAFSGFAFGFVLARHVFHRPLADCVAIGFACTFSNSLLLGVPITERAFGAAATAGNYAIISVHAPIIYSFGIVLMEWVRATETGGKGAAALLQQIVRGVFTQPLVVGLACGFVVNLSGFAQPESLKAAVGFMAASAIPTALFGLGGVLYRYRPEGDRALVGVVVFASLVLHPAITYSLGRWGFHLPPAGLRSATITAAMAPGVNAYMFAFMYGVGKRVAATSILVATALTIFTAWGWLHILS